MCDFQKRPGIFLGLLCKTKFATSESVDLIQRTLRQQSPTFETIPYRFIFITLLKFY